MHLYRARRRIERGQASGYRLLVRVRQHRATRYDTMYPGVAKVDRNLQRVPPSAETQVPVAAGNAPSQPPRESQIWSFNESLALWRFVALRIQCVCRAQSCRRTAGSSGTLLGCPHPGTVSGMVGQNGGLLGAEWEHEGRQLLRGGRSVRRHRAGGGGGRRVGG